MLISRETINEIQSKCDIVEVVSYHVPLKKSGRNFKCLCPFHHEKTPSFMVNPEKQIFHCFGCGVGGNVFSFVMDIEKVDFRESVRILADRVGVKIKSSGRGEDREHSLKEQIFNVNELAMRYFEKILMRKEYGAKGMAYLRGRYFSDESISRFCLGVSRDEWADLYNAATKKGFSAFVLEKAGLIIKSDKKQSYYDRFRSRLIFPIFNVYNKVIGFGARAIDDAMPKYLNTSETEVFSKGRNLYGLNLAKGAILEQDMAILVEGYTDCIRMHQADIVNCVATLGTALTSEHAMFLKRYTQNILMVFDSDAAGQTAMLRSLDIFLEEDLSVRIAVLPEGHDPDSYFYEFGYAGLDRLKTKSKDFFQFKIDLLKSRVKDLDIQAKVRISDEMFYTVRKVSNEIMRKDLLGRLAGELELDESVVVTEFNASRKTGVRSVKKEKSVRDARAPLINTAEAILLKVMLHYPETIACVRGRISASKFLNHDCAKIAAILLEEDAPDDHIASRVINRLTEVKTHRIVASLTEDRFEIDNRDQVVEDCLVRMEENFHKSKTEELQKMIKKMEQDENYDEMKKYLKEYKVLKEMESAKRN